MGFVWRFQEVSDIRDRFHRVVRPIAPPVSANSLATSFIVSVAPARSNHLITIRGFYTTHPIMCQRFSGVLIIFFHHSLYIDAMRSEYFASMIRRFTFIVGVSSPASIVSSEESNRNLFTVS